MLILAAALSLQAGDPEPDFHWLSGHWVRETETRRLEEVWTSADGGLMTGMNRTVRSDGRTAFEYMRIEFTDPPVYVAQPSGGAPVRFDWVSGDEASALFANPQHDFPTHIEYARDGDTLTARIWGPDDEGQAITWSWTLRAE